MSPECKKIATKKTLVSYSIGTSKFNRQLLYVTTSESSLRIYMVIFLIIFLKVIVKIRRATCWTTVNTRKLKTLWFFIPKFKILEPV